MDEAYSVIDLLDNDEALSLPYERVVGLLGDAGLDKRIRVLLLAVGV